MLRVNHLAGFGAGSSGFLPTDIANLDTWVRADLGVTKDGSDFVSSWADQSGNGRNFTEATNKPLWQSSQKNGHPAILFDGSNDLLTASSWSLAQPYHIFMVVDPVTRGENHTFLGGTTSSSLGVYYPAAASADVKHLAFSAATGAVNLPNGAFYLLQSFLDGASSFQTKNDGTPVTGNPGTADPGGLTIATSSGLGGVNGNINVAELAVYSAEITGTNLTALESYFNARYALW